ncbi:MAG: hypothetical protein FJ104_07630 [Deltaproteobacteria bacterium]|nr:hypothetical protein [Deltaproteobacteria bacterium]
MNFLPVPTGREPSQARPVKRQARRMDQFAATVETYRDAMKRIRDRGAVAQEEFATLGTWMSELGICGVEFRLFACGPCGTAAVVAPCCHLSICPRTQHRRAKKWRARAAALAELLPNNPRGADFKRVAGLTKKALGKATMDVNDHTWKAFEFSLRLRGTLKERVNATIKLRTKFMRHMRRRYGMMACFASLDLSPSGLVHVHAIAYCGYAPRADLQRWLRSQDCTISGCTHEADDRCGACTAAKRGDCPHPHANGRPRCNGSWYVDVRKCYARGTKEHHDPVVAGVIEALKYAAAPVGTKPGGEHDAPAPGAVPTEAQLAHAEQLVLYYLAIRRWKVVETCGLARLPDPHEEHGADDREPEAEGGVPICPECGEPMRYAVTGTRFWGRCNQYRLMRERFPARGRGS